MKQFYKGALLTILYLSSFKSFSQAVIAGETGYGSGIHSLSNYLDFDFMGFPYSEYYEVGQTFKSTLTTNIATIEFYAAQSNSSGNVNVQIYSSSSQTSWGSLLATKTNVPLNSVGWVTVDVSALNVSVVAGNYYGFKLIPQYGLDAGVGANNNLYPDGQAWASNGGGGFYIVDDWAFKVTSNITLPVNLISFTAQKQNDEVLLKWSTASEQNSKDFSIQYSMDGVNWNTIKTIPAAGNSNTIKSYSYLHTAPDNGINYYRIQQTDMDGKSSMSAVRTIKFTNDPAAFTIVANPVCNGLLQIQVNNTSSLSLYSVNGRLLWKKQFNAGLQHVDVSNYAKGLYLLRDNSRVEKILVQ